MALATLKFLSYEGESARFSIDTGTNPWYTLKIGRGSYKDHFFDIIDGVVSETGLRRNEKSSNILDSDLLVALPAKRFSETDCYVQLQTFKNESGRAPAWSKIIKMRVPLRPSRIDQDAYSFSYSQNRFAMYQEPLNAQRNIPFAETGRPASGKKEKWEQLRQLVESASPMVTGMLNGQQRLQSKPAPRLCSAIGLLNIILNLFANGWGTQQMPVPGTVAVAASARMGRRHRFATSRAKSDAVTATDVSVPIMQESAEEKMIQTIIAQIQKEALLGAFLDNQGGDGGIDMNKLMQLLQQPAATGMPAKPVTAPATAPPINKPATPVQGSNQPGANGSTGNGSQTNASAGATASAAGTAGAGRSGTGTSAAGTTIGGTSGSSGSSSGDASAQNGKAASEPDLFSTPQSLSRRRYSFVMSDQSLLVFEPGPVFPVNGKDVSVYKKTAIRFRVRLNVISESPLAAIPKAIATFTFKGPDNNVVLEKMFHKTDVVAGEAMQIDFTEYELNPLPVGKAITLTAELRWPDPVNQSIIVKAFGNTSVVFTDGFLPKAGGVILPMEKELVSMEQYRPFWNKVWESPVGGGKPAGADGFTKKHWSLDVDLLYRIKCCGDKESNGLMQTKMLLNEQDGSGITEAFEGKLKSGIELSITELNKLCTLWGKKPLENGQLAAVRASEAVSGKIYESIYHVKLKGKMRDRGMVWIVPVLGLQEIILSEASKTDENGRVTEMNDLPVQVPVPASIRIITLKSI